MNRIKELLEEGLITQEEYELVIHALLRDVAVEVELTSDEDGLGTIHMATCSFCGETLEFRRNSQVRGIYLYCYQCGTKLKPIKTESE